MLLRLIGRVEVVEKKQDETESELDKLRECLQRFENS
jgi:hypothetical protein